MSLQSLKSEWTSFTVGIANMYSALDPETAMIRGAHLNTVKRLTPYTMGANAGSATLILWAFRGDLHFPLILWWAALVGLSVFTTYIWFRASGRVSLRASPRSVTRLTWHSAFLAGIWAVIPVFLFPFGTPEQQIIVATLVTGMLGAGTFVLNPLPRASLVYATIYSLSAFVAIWRSGNPLLGGVAVLLSFYAPMVVVGSLYAWRKSTQVLRSEAKALRQERMVAVLLQDFEEHAGDALWETDKSGNLTHISARFLELAGLSQNDIDRYPIAKLLANGGPVGLEALTQAFASGRPFQDIGLEFRHDGVVRHLAVSGKRFTDSDGDIRGWRGVLTDTTEKVEGERRLRMLAHTDSLTGLSNRFTFRDRLIESLRRKEWPAVLFIDLDKFKAVNDSLGHSVGDELLRAVAFRFASEISQHDVLARIGGDEFAVLMTGNASKAMACQLAQRLIDVLKMPLSIGGRQLKVGASIGVAVCQDDRTGLDDLLVQSDSALYSAKAAGRGQFALYSVEIGEAGRRRLMIEEGLRAAISAGQVELYWQPKVSIVTGRVVSAEALMRWSHPVLGPINPMEFISIAEQSGQIEDLGRWALVHACECAASHLQGLSIAVNVSPMQLQDDHIVTNVRNALQLSGLEPSRLELEITESVFMDGAEGAFGKLFALRELGVKIALDDFGTGYSSLAYLRRFPFDTLKIDRAFVIELMQSKDARAIVLMISQLASRLGMRTVAEGVETSPQLAAVAQAGCDEVQGYLVSPPVPLGEFLERTQQWKLEAVERRIELADHRFSDSTFV